MFGKKQIIFVESGPADTISKISRALKKKGYETVLIMLTGNIESAFLKESFDKIISFDFKFFRINLSNLPAIFLYGLKKFPKILRAIIEIKKLNPYVVIGMATPNWLCALTKKYLRKSPFIYFPYDIRSFSYKDIEDSKKRGKIPRFELKAERYCFENSDGIMHKGDNMELTFLNKKVLGNIEIKCPTFYLFPPCSKDLITPVNEKEKLSNKDKEIHVVYVGSIDEEGLEQTKIVLDQKLHFHIYGKNVQLSKEELYEDLNKVFKSMMKSKFFHLHDSVDQKVLPKEISKYDYGLYSFFDQHKPEVVHRVAIGNKVASYLEAGLPVIYFKAHKALSETLNKYKIGIPIRDSSDLKNLKKNLEKNEPEKFTKRILKAREDLCIENDIPKLERFFNKVRIYKKLQK